MCNFEIAQDLNNYPFTELLIYEISSRSKEFSVVPGFPPAGVKKAVKGLSSRPETKERSD
jgi:hypothetical protein